MKVGGGWGLRKEEEMWSGVGLEKFLVMKYTTPSVGHGCIPALRKLRRESSEFETRLNHKVCSRPVSATGPICKRMKKEQDCLGAV